MVSVAAQGGGASCPDCRPSERLHGRDSRPRCGLAVRQRRRATGGAPAPPDGRLAAAADTDTLAASGGHPSGLAGLRVAPAQAGGQGLHGRFGRGGGDGRGTAATVLPGRPVDPDRPPHPAPRRGGFRLFHPVRQATHRPLRSQHTRSPRRAAARRGLLVSRGDGVRRGTAAGVHPSSVRLATIRDEGRPPRASWRGAALRG